MLHVILVFAPLVGFLIAGLFGRVIGARFLNEPQDHAQHDHRQHHDARPRVISRERKRGEHEQQDHERICARR